MHPRDRYTGILDRTSTKPAVGGLVAAEVRMTVQEYLELIGKLAEQGVILLNHLLDVLAHIELQRLVHVLRLVHRLGDSGDPGMAV